MGLSIKSNRARRSGFLAGALTAIFAIALQPLVMSGVTAVLAETVTINEVMANPVEVGEATTEWIELRNNGEIDVDISGWTIAGATVPASQSIAASGLYVLCKSNEATAECDGVSTTGMTLTNTGQTLQLKNAANELVDEFSYGGSTNGESIEVIRENGTTIGAHNTTDSYDTNQAPPQSGNTGTPGAVNTQQPTATAVTNMRTGMVYDDLEFAIADATASDTLRLNQDLTITSDVDVTKAVVINGNGHSISASFIRSGNSNNAVLSVTANDVTVRNVTLNGGDPFVNKLHGLNIVGAQNVLAEGVNTNNFRSGILYVSSTGTIRNVTTSGSIWSAINIDRSAGVGLPGSSVTIEGTNSHAENSPSPVNNYVDGAIDPVNATVPHLFIDDATDTGIVVNDVGNQYKINEVAFRGGVALLGTYGASVSSAETEQDVYVNTFDGSNGWVFGSPAPYDSPFAFTTDAASIGTGSLGVGPVQSDAADKFIAYYFTDQPMKNIESFRYDYKLDGATPIGKANEFYLNVYAKFETPGSGWYDCRYDVVPTIGSQTAFTPVSFDPAQTTSNVTQHSGAPVTCPARPLAMGANASIVYMALNVGDTSSSDVGVGGFYDNVRYQTATGTTIYDFEYTPDPLGQNDLNISVNKFHNRNADRDRDSAGEEWLAGWQVRLYKENGSEWELVSTRTTTGTSSRVAFPRQAEAGTYHICEVAQLGWTQVRQDWSGTVYHAVTDNISPNASEEGPYCATVGYADTADRSAVKYLGNRYNDQDDTHHLNLTGLVFNNLNTDRDRDAGEAVLSDWTVRVYKEDAAGDWQFVKTGDTRVSDNKYAVMMTDATAGVYHACLVAQTGWDQVRQDWSGTSYHLVTDNMSGESDEYPYCSTVVFDDSGDRSNAKYFGLTDSEKPSLSVTSPAPSSTVGGEVQVAGASDDNDSVSSLELRVFAGASCSGSAVLGPVDISSSLSGTDFDHTFDTTSLDGVYCFKVTARDESGNKRFTEVESVTIDNTAPLITIPSSPAPDQTPTTLVLGATTQRSASTDSFTPFGTQLPGVSLFAQTAGGGQNSTDDEDATDETTDKPIEVLGEDNEQSTEGTLEDDVVVEDGCASLFGLCWYWWVPIGLAGFAVVYVLVRAASEDDELPPASKR